MQADGPVGPARAGHADDVEFDAATERMTLQGVADADPELRQGCRGFGEKGLEKHVAFPFILRQPRQGGGLSCAAIVGANVVNSGLSGGRADPRADPRIAADGIDDGSRLTQAPCADSVPRLAPPAPAYQVLPSRFRGRANGQAG